MSKKRYEVTLKVVAEADDERDAYETGVEASIVLVEGIREVVSIHVVDEVKLLLEV